MRRAGSLLDTVKVWSITGINGCSGHKMATTISGLHSGKEFDVALHLRNGVASRGAAELMVFYCERATGFCRDVGHEDAGYFDALVRIFEEALRTTNRLAANVRDGLLTRLDLVRSISHEFGYGVGDDMDVLLSEFVPSFQHRGAS